MITNIPAETLRNLLNLVSQSRDQGPSLAGAIVKAKVVDITEDGSAILRLISSAGRKGSMQGATIKAAPDIPLEKGQTLFLEILGGKDSIQLKFVSDAGDPSQSAKQNSPARLIDLLVMLSESKLSDAESRQLLNILKSLPQDIKNASPALKELENLLQNTHHNTSTRLKSGIARSLLTLTAETDRSVSVKAGTIVKAELVDNISKGTAVFRFIASDSSSATIPGTSIKTGLPVPLSKGQSIYFEILGGTDKIEMRIVKGFQNTVEAQQSFPIKFLDMFAELSQARMGNAEFKLLYNMLKSLPQPVKTAIPEFQNLEKLVPDIKQIDGKQLKAFVESSGVAFETRLKVAVLKDPGSMLQNLMALQSEGDLKALLLNLKNLLKDQNLVNILKQAGHNVPELSNMADSFIKTIEFFQFSSRLNDMFHTFLPVMWDDLRDSEFTFRKGKKGRKGSCTCGIKLDLESLGKLSIAVTVSDNAFYITFHAEESNMVQLIQSNKHLLEKSFESQGLTLKAINIDQKKIVFGEPQRQGIDVKA